jgi:transcription elongation factor Elf1
MEKTTPGPERFQDQNLSLYHFKDRVTVVCPQCTRRAEVRTDLTTYHTTFHCPNCHHHRTSDNTRTELNLRTFCNACGHRIVVHRPDVKVRKQALRVKCPACHAVASYPPEYRSYRGFGGTTEGTDPFLGLDLWYRDSLGEHLFWAYNYDHLHYLEGYIGASLRERKTASRMSMVEKLPRFMQLAKNRGALLKLIARLKRK